MTDLQTCEACGQPILLPIRMQKCDKCGCDLMANGGRYVKRNGVCVPQCFPCAGIAESGANALEAKLL